MPVGLPSDLLLRRPDVRAAERRIGSVSWTVFDAGRIRFRVQAEAAAHRRTVLSALRDVETALVA